MSLEKHNFAFGDFVLDPEEQVLFRHDKPVSITPKAFQLLLILVQNRGHLVEKDRLIGHIWPDSFVEDGNLAVAMNQLRKILDDRAQDPAFIETVPRRGYRFVAEVRDTGQNGQVVQHDVAAIEPLVSVTPRFFASSMVRVLSVILVVTLILGSAWFVRTRFLMERSIDLIAFRSEKLSTTGKVSHAVISRDGKNVFYTNVADDDRQSVWLRQLDSTNNVQIIPPSDDFYYGLETSPDGRFLYFVRRPLHEERQGDIFRVSIFGGIPVKVIDAAQGWMSISADGSLISFVRCERRVEENCSLWIADADNGANERKIAARPKPFRIADNEISPDGRSVVFAAGQSENSGSEFGLVKIDIASGAERPLTSEKFFNIKGLAWPSKGNDLIVAASRVPNQMFRLWRISGTSGEVRSLSQDSESYNELSVDDEMSRLVSVTTRPDFQAVLYSMDGSVASHVLADASKVEFANDGQMLISSAMSGNQEIWCMNRDGSGQRQLTNDPSDDTDPLIDSKLNTIFFASNRTGSLQVWRMNLDGSDPAQVTHNDGGFPNFVTADGRWLYYHHGISRTLWRIDRSSGEEEEVIGPGKYRWAISSDGELVAFASGGGARPSIDVVSLKDKHLLRSLTVGSEDAKLGEIAWLPDGSGIAFILADNEFRHSKLWTQSLNGDGPKLLADLGDEHVDHLKISRDQRSFAVVRGDWRHDAVLLRGVR
ncbi:MAG: winged helix-turn-helix domain-containing protein [Pyrinomonadaceae bacterium]